MTYLFLASIGPIQSFIASARRTRDLWFGSTLLSELSKTVALTIIRNENNMLIFPAPQHNRSLVANSDLKVPNKILARITDDPEILGKDIGREIRANIEVLYNRLFATLEGRKFDQDVARMQIADLVEYIWVAHKEDDDIDLANANYRETRKQLEGLMAARKHTRSYDKVTWSSENHKSSIDGKLECVIPKDLYSGNWNQGSPNEQIQKAQRELTLFTQFRAGKAERLSGVDLLKRMGEFSADKAQQGSRAFFSTSHIASLPYLQRLRILSASDSAVHNVLRSSWGTYARIVETIYLPDSSDNTQPLPVYEQIPRGKAGHPIIDDRDGALLYGERLIEDANNPDRLLLATNSLQKFFTTVNEYANGENLSPTPYYAIIVADGDGMGKIIDYESQHGPEQHRNISIALDKFDKEVIKIVEVDNEGGLIYSGGDDVLAFVPLHRMLACVKDLSATFKNLLKGFRDAEEKKPTLSIGVAIVHHLSLLNDAREQAQAAKETAKAVSGKNALAIKLCKRGGEEYTISGHWENLDVYLEQLISHYQAKRIPKGLPYELRESLLRLTALMDNHHTDDLIKVIKSDAKRILERKLKVPKKKKNSETSALFHLLSDRIDINLDELSVQLQEEVQKSDKLLIDGLKDKQDLSISVFYRVMQTYIHELIIAKELADVYILANGQPKAQILEAHV